VLSRDGRVFAAAGAAVSILNGTPTPSVAGATFYVGYGASGSSMLSEGDLPQRRDHSPAAGTCPPLPYQTALWWNPGESGWGLNLNQQGTTIFGTLFTYDSARRAAVARDVGGHDAIGRPSRSPATSTAPPARVQRQPVHPDRARPT
jgi:hypothetical protein